MQIYYAQRKFVADKGKYASSIKELGLVPEKMEGVKTVNRFKMKSGGYVATVEMEAGPMRRPLTTITGRVIDQAALQAMLSILYDMQLPLVSVDWLPEEEQEPRLSDPGDQRPHHGAMSRQ